MILSVSNIAWAPEERLEAYDILAEAGIAGLEIAPGLFFQDAADPFAPDVSTAAAALEEISARGLSLVSMQSLLFGLQGAQLLGDPDARTAFEIGITRAIDLAERFGIPNLVFGSPEQRRIPEGMVRAEGWAQAADFFRKLGDHAAAAGTSLAMEANPAAYGTNFLITLEEAEEFVAQVDHPAVKLVIDLGTMHINGTFDSIVQRIPVLVSRLSHVHVSEPHLAPAPNDTTNLKPVFASLQRAGYGRAVSLEMRRPKDGLAGLHSRVTAMATAASKTPE